VAKPLQIPRRLTAILVYTRPLLAIGALVCAIAVMWLRDPVVYILGVVMLLISMVFDLVDGWFAARFHPHPNLAQLADRILDKVVYSIIFPLIAVGVTWRLTVINPAYTRTELLHAILVLILGVTVLIRDNFAHFMRGFAIRQGQEPEGSELNRLRTMVAAPVGALLYAYAFYIPEGPPSRLYFWISWLGNIPQRGLFFIEIIFLIINLGSIAGYTRKYGSYCLDELCLGEERLRRQILTFFPNALTVMNAMMGLLAVFFAHQERIREAYLILIGAALFDKLDGALARRLGLTEPLDPKAPPKRITMGGVLDDVSDGISFCIVPAWIFYIVTRTGNHPTLTGLPLGWIAFAYGAGGIARLVYFTLDTKPIPGFFKGLPTPAGALLVMAPMVMLAQAAGGSQAERQFWSVFCVVTMIFAAVWMNFYPLRYLHFGRLMNRRPVVVSLTLILALLLVFTPYFGYFTLVCMTVYLVSPLWTWRISPEIAASEKRIRKKSKA
jgi:CDP-diacylglycerol--serine O-phosphatidyltransferase